MTRDIGYYGVVVLALTFLGQIFGFFREVTFGKYFGTTGAFDAFTIVFSVILFVTALLNVIPFLLIPTLAESLSQKNRVEFSKQLTAILILVFGFVGVSIIVGEIWAEHTLDLVAPGLKENSEIFGFVLLLMRVSAPIILLLALSRLLRSLLNLYGKFAPPALESLFFNVGVIVAVIVGWNFFDIKSPLSIPFGYYLAYLLFIPFCFFFVVKQLRFSWFADIVSLKTIFIGISTLLLATFLTCLNPLVLMWNASLLEEGAISALGYVQRLMSFSIGTFVNSFLVVFLPMASISFIKGGSENLRVETEKMMLSFLIFSLYVLAIIMFNGETLVRLIYQRGAFHEGSVKLVSGLLYYYLPWILFFPLSNTAVRVLYVHKDYRTLVIVAAAGLSFTLVLAPVLRRLLGVNGLGLMSSLHMMVYAILLLTVIHVKHFKMRYRSMGVQLLPQAGVIVFMVFILLVLQKVFSFTSTEFFVVSMMFLGTPFIWWLNKYVNLLGILKKQLLLLPGR